MNKGSGSAKQGGTGDVALFHLLLPAAFPSFLTRPCSLQEGGQPAIFLGVTVLRSLLHAHGLATHFLVILAQRIIEAADGTLEIHLVSDAADYEDDEIRCQALRPKRPCLLVLMLRSRLCWFHCAPYHLTFLKACLRALYCRRAIRIWNRSSAERTICLSTSS